MTSTTLETLDLLAHELRNATNVVVAGGRLLTEAAPDDDNVAADSSSIGADILQSGQSLAGWIDRLIECARCELERTPSSEPTSLAAVVESGIKRAQRANPSLSAQIPVPIEADMQVLVPIAIAERVIADAVLLASRSCDEVAIRCKQGDTTVELHIAPSGAVAVQDRSNRERATLLMMEALARYAQITIATDDVLQAITARFEQPDT